MKIETLNINNFEFDLSMIKKGYFIKKLILFLFFISLNSCYTVKTTNYIEEKNYAIFYINSKDASSNFTDVKEGLKVTYDFWGNNVIIVLENISDKTIFVDLNNSFVTTGKQKEIYNNMISGTFNVLPLEPGTKIEVDDFIFINEDNEEKIKEKIKEAQKFTELCLTFKSGDFPLKLTNTIQFSLSEDLSDIIEIKDNFYSDRVKIINQSDLEHLVEFGKDKLYNKTFYETRTTRIQEKSHVETLIPIEDMVELVFYAIIFAVGFYN